MTEDPQLEFRILGPLEVEGGSGPIALGGQKQRALLAALLLDAVGWSRPIGWSTSSGAKMRRRRRRPRFRTRYPGSDASSAPTCWRRAPPATCFASRRSRSTRAGSSVFSGTREERAPRNGGRSSSRRCHCGAAPRWPSSRSRTSLRRKSAVSRSCGWSRTRSGSRRISSSAATVTSRGARIARA